MTKGSIWVEVSKCLACKSCEFACAVAHSTSKTVHGAIRETPLPESRVSLVAVEELAIPLQCRHCEDAPCVSICPTDALVKTEAEGPVLIDVDRCIGCKFCIAVCPFGVITMSRDGKAALKCDLCIERLKEGQQPACVEACHTGALRFGEITEAVRRAREQAARRLVTSAEQAEKIKSKDE
jgi:carbon-monoxide dehydrogenase iron sulfur subunit